jgi:hypothetical protein
MKTLLFKLPQGKFNQKLAELQEEVGNDLNTSSPSSGIVKHSGVSAHYSYDAATEVLTIVVDHKPFLVPESVIEAKLGEWFDSK